jgi:transposase
MGVYVGMDVHRKRSQVAIVDDTGVLQRNRNIANDPAKLVPILGVLPPGTPVAFEAAYGWGWLVELLEELELEPHLVHPSRCKAIASARLKNDKVDAATLAQLLRADLLPEAWIAPQATRDLRALLRHRASLVRLATSLKNRVHAVLADRGISECSGLWTAPGRAWLASAARCWSWSSLSEKSMPPPRRAADVGLTATTRALLLTPIGCGIVGSSWCLGASWMRG